ncbi:hypothetical protein SCP_0302820 [Sparassis crispa]|uniref:Uncharacterized protein n=1 Tax=Sparassis crispa TaxID=139825 RepID=A0A401GEH8_9APHY|nr:hypothetical protein SCP_0302820 [Sparassis crispa]GBE80567.1 hypothetical protein SCP_0302820 [Sparassis crispa]
MLNVLSLTHCCIAALDCSIVAGYYHRHEFRLRNPNESVAAGIVGPMGSRSFSLPNVEHSLTEMEGGVGGAGGGTAALGMSVSGDAARKLGRRATGRPPSTLTVPSAGGAGRSSAPLPTPFSVGSPSPTGGHWTQHEVLQNFLLSLLSSTDRTGTSGRAASPKANSNITASVNVSASEMGEES